jgi:hypothetical protein
MLETLRFVRGAVATKDLIPVLRHFRISGGRIQGQNGRVCIDAPWTGPDMDEVVDAVKFLRAVDACGGEPKISIKDSWLTISRGKFRARLATLLTSDYPTVEDRQDWPYAVSVGEKTMAALRLLQPFIATDASRPWACSILISGGRAYATNNAVLAVVDMPWWEAQDVVLPDFLVDELLRIGEAPRDLAWSDSALCAHYADGSWLWSKRIEGAWPGTLHQLSAKLDAVEEWHDVPQDLREALAQLRPFFPDAKWPIVRTGEAGVSTNDGESSAAISVGALPEAAFRMESLDLVATVAKQWNLSESPVPWRAEGVAGLLTKVIVGQM